MEARDSIKRHYNQIPNRSLSERKNLDAINIRNYNNFIKSCLFRKFIYLKDTVLDFGIGKGGDFRKYQKSEISLLYGLDIANRSLLDALARAREFRLDFKLILKNKDCYTRPFDLYKQFNIISIQFSFHYSFEREEYIDCTLGNISRHLLNGGHVLITLPCKEEILKRKMRNALSNRFFKIEFVDPNNKAIYGNSYYYTLQGSLNECIEYLVDVPTLRTKALKYGLELIENCSFDCFFDENVALNEELYSYMKLVELTSEEHEVTSLHHILVFRKRNI